jgi:uncharacterized membrane protein YgdD (TMEM256/DUF423 family)
MSKLFGRVLLVSAGLMGAAGVAAAASASHGESRNLAAVATMFLAHAPVLLIVGLWGQGRAFMGAAAALGVGTALFGADLAMREYAGHALFAGAAPVGGGLMVLGWLGLTLAGALTSPRI